MDISKLSAVQLRDLLQKIPGELKRRESEEKRRYWRKPGICKIPRIFS